MENIMEPDELKAAWQLLGRQLERHDSINLQLLRENKLDKARSSLRPLLWGQVLQIALGLFLLLLGIACWKRNLHLPGYLIAGILVHAYGVACIVMAGITLGLIGGIDYSAPVLKIQKQLTTLRRFYVFSGLAVGLPWWIMWVPVVLAFAGLAERPSAAATPLWIWISLGVGALGLLATWGFHRWSHRPGRAEFGRKLDHSLTGHSLRKAQALLDEVRDFGKE